VLLMMLLLEMAVMLLMMMVLVVLVFKRKRRISPLALASSFFRAGEFGRLVVTLLSWCRLPCSWSWQHHAQSLNIHKAHVCLCQALFCGIAVFKPTNFDLKKSSPHCKRALQMQNGLQHRVQRLNRVPVVIKQE
jgi:hypothetical protein